MKRTTRLAFGVAMAVMLLATPLVGSVAAQIRHPIDCEVPGLEGENEKQACKNSPMPNTGGPVGAAVTGVVYAAQVFGDDVVDAAANADTDGDGTADADELGTAMSGDLDADGQNDLDELTDVVFGDDD